MADTRGFSTDEIFNGTADAVVDRFANLFSGQEQKLNDIEFLNTYLRAQRRSATLQLIESMTRYEVSESKLTKLKSTDEGKKDKEKIAALSAEVSNAATHIFEWQTRLQAIIKLTTEFAPMTIISENYGSLSPDDGVPVEPKKEEVKE